MGTRNLTMVVLDGEMKVAQYGQWDGYPEGQGATVFQFIADGKADEVFTEKVRATCYGTVEYEGEVPPPNFHRDTAADILDYIRDEPSGMVLHNSRIFAYDSLFCEWAYLLDLDRRVLEVYEGFNKKPVTEGRFLSTDPEMQDDYVIGKKEYHPIVKIDEIPFEIIEDGSYLFDNFLQNIVDNRHSRKEDKE